MIHESVDLLYNLSVLWAELESLAHAPIARAEPPMLPVVPASGRLDFTKASVAMLVELSEAGCVIAVAPFVLPPMDALPRITEDKGYVLSAVALGLSADLVLELHCASGNALHLLLGHASIGVAWLAAWFVLRRASVRS